MASLIYPPFPARTRSFPARKSLRVASVNTLLSCLGTAAIMVLLIAGIVAGWQRREAR